MPNNIEITIGSFSIPMRNLFQLYETTTPNESTNVVLDGSRYTDFTNNMRSWTLSFAYLCKEDFDDLYQVYLDQYNNAAYPDLVVPYYDIDSPVKLSVKANKDIKFDGDMIVDYEITLEEQYPFS